MVVGLVTHHQNDRISKGDTIFIPILAMNRRKELWGEDADEFKPERWLNLPGLVADIPGAWASQMTFLYGPRACIGYRFAVME
jgi:cytochrome P450